jgi:hypothetical protein
MLFPAGNEYDKAIFIEAWKIAAVFIDPNYQRRGYMKRLFEWVFESRSLSVLTEAQHVVYFTTSRDPKVQEM